MKQQDDKKNASIWRLLQKKEELSDQQLEQFQQYAGMLAEWNKKMNLTAITDLPGIVSYHFRDSLHLDRFVQMDTIKTIADVGTGAGFPGIPLKIKYPHLSLVLIEVNQKKIGFLEAVIRALGLNGIEVCSLDWRTFLRRTDYEIDLFCVRASLHTDELMRMFKPSCPYKNAQLVYWASMNWEIGKREVPFELKREIYNISHKQRQYVFFGLKPA